MDKGCDKGNVRLTDQKIEAIQYLYKQFLDLMLDKDSMKETIDIEVREGGELTSMRNTLEFRVEQSVSEDSPVNNPAPSTLVFKPVQKNL
ncbi:hypothetical protein JTB14_024825 [Gonioctena quinquepunctata]|nr:hypothetical protein JTB14_024825 [Gonioctena quinquepunctata]